MNIEKIIKEKKGTIVDVRSPGEFMAGNVNGSINIPLHELRERTNEIPRNKPIVVHCAAGFRSAAGSSIIKSKVNDSVQVYDLGAAVKKFKNEPHKQI